MTLTRRTLAFGEIAERLDEILSTLGIGAPTEAVDALLNEEIRCVAAGMGISERTTLKYFPPERVEEIAKLILATYRKLSAKGTSETRTARPVDSYQGDVIDLATWRKR